MPDTGSLAIRTRTSTPGAVRISCEGYLDYATADRLTDCGQRLLAAGCRQLELDLSGLDLFDSSGLRSLLRIRDAVEGSGGRLRLVVSPHLERVLHVTGLDRVFDVMTRTSW